MLFLLMKQLFTIKQRSSTPYRLIFIYKTHFQLLISNSLKTPTPAYLVLLSLQASLLLA